jgi:hypothetical protein
MNAEDFLESKSIFKEKKVSKKREITKDHLEVPSKINTLEISQLFSRLTFLFFALAKDFHD